MENKRLRVLHLINNLRREGAQVMVYNLVTSSEAKNIQHSVCVREAGGPLQTSFEEAGIPVFTTDKYYGLSSTNESLKFINKIIENEAIDIVHAHMADAAFIGWRVASMNSLPLVITHHGQNILPACNPVCRTVYFFLLFFAARYARYNVAVSSSVIDVVHRKLKIGMRRIRLIANGVPIPSKNSLSKKRFKKDSHLCIVSVGRLVELKGHIQLIDAVKILIKEYKNTKTYFVGDGPLRESLEHRVKSLKLTDNVFFVGSVDNVTTYLENADLYVSTSHYEGLPVATLEAMARGCPVIVSDVPGNNEVVKNGVTGILYRLGDVEELAEAINKIASDPEKARISVDQAYQMVKDHYNSEFVSKSYNKIYSEILMCNLES